MFIKDIINNEAMEDHSRVIASLMERATEYGKTSFELIKLKALDKTADVVSSLIPNSVVIVIILTFLLFFSLGMSLLLGEALGKVFYGFFVVAAFYGIAGVIVHFAMHKWLKRLVSNSFIKKVLK
jgi:hypothetical protein